MADIAATCTSCGAHLSKYRNHREKQCAPCQARIIEESLNHAYEAHENATRKQEAYCLRWFGYEWETIAMLLEYATSQAATSAARDYAKKKGLVLP
jgi:reverse gyrase